jgi:hypothetical protein
MKVRKRLMFYIGNHPVGRFRGRCYPTQPGRVEYTPFRGTGHAKLARSLRAGVPAECWFIRSRKQFAFEVVREEFVVGPSGSSSNWYLEISRLASHSANQPE